MNSYVISPGKWDELVEKKGIQFQVLVLEESEALFQAPYNSIDAFTGYPFFALEDGTPFAYNFFEDILFYPEGLDPEVIKSSTLDFGNWKIAFTGEEKPYIVNEYKRTQWLDYDERGYKTGTYRLSDELFGTTLDVAIWNSSGSWCRECYICYPEKTKMRTADVPGPIKRLDEFYKIIFEVNGKSYRESDQGGQ